MIVDDASGIRHLVGQFLQEQGYETVEAIDGLDGMEQLKVNPDVSLIICDINMPNMDGITMVEAIRAELKNHHVKVLMLTTERRSDLKKRAKSAGVNGWLVKPFNGPNSLELIKRLVD